MDADKLSYVRTIGVLLVIVVMVFAKPPSLQPILENYKLKLVEDAAQGFGGEIDGRKA